MTPRSSAPRASRTAPALAPESLAFSLYVAAQNVTDVIQGHTLTSALERRWQAAPALTTAVRAAVQDLSYSALRDFGHGDFLLDSLLRERLKETGLHALLLVALARLAARPDEAHTIVDQTVNAASMWAHGSFKGVANGVLRNALRRRDELEQAAAKDEVARWKHPPWWIHRIRSAYPDNWQAILACGNGRPPMALRVNALRGSVDDYARRLREADVGARAFGPGLLLDRPLPVERLPGFAEGWVSVQDLGAQRAAGLLDLAPGQRVLDACAAPGSKTCHILETAEVDVLALDADPLRAARIEQNLDRLGLGARVVVADCRDTGRWWDGRPFDRILADVPCSASGVVRRHPDIKWLRRESDLAKFARQQAEILEALWRVLAPGGKLLYATCSLFPEENSRVLAEFARRQGEECKRLPSDGELDLQLLPDDLHDGFYYALLQKQ